MWFIGSTPKVTLITPTILVRCHVRFGGLFFHMPSGQHRKIKITISKSCGWWGSPVAVVKPLRFVRYLLYLSTVWHQHRCENRGFYGIPLCEVLTSSKSLGKNYKSNFLWLGGSSSMKAPLTPTILMSSSAFALCQILWVISQNQFVSWQLWVPL